MASCHGAEVGAEPTSDVLSLSEFRLDGVMGTHLPEEEELLVRIRLWATRATNCPYSPQMDSSIDERHRLRNSLVESSLAKDAGLSNQSSWVRFLPRALL